MTAGLTYGVTGRMFIGTVANPITAVDGTGGEEILGVQGRNFVFDTGIVLESTKDQVHHDTVKKMVGPGLLDVPLHDVDDIAVKEIMRPFWDATGMRATGGAVPAIYQKIPGIQILILPTVATDGAGNPIKVIYLKAAKLNPESQSNYNLSLDEPLFPGISQWKATSVEGDDGKDPWMVDVPDAVTAEYF